MNKFKTLVSSCATTTGKRNVENMVTYLKSIGNIGHCKSMISVLSNCFKQKSTNIEIRLAAINALRRMPCDAGQSDNLWTVFNDKTNDIEIRITALVQLSKCTNDEFRSKFEQAYDRETDNQVGSFMYTLVKTKSTTSDPTQRDTRDFFDTVAITKKFSVNPQKNSVMIESGHFDRKWNAGAQVEKGIITTSDSKVPVNFYANMTVQLFGSSINLLEVGGRQEGLGDLMDDLFGSEGYYTNAEAWEFG
jgi:hypothetical protein